MNQSLTKCQQSIYYIIMLISLACYHYVNFYVTNLTEFAVVLNLGIIFLMITSGVYILEKYDDFLLKSYQLLRLKLLFIISINVIMLITYKSNDGMDNSFFIFTTCLYILMLIPTLIIIHFEQLSLQSRKRIYLK